MRPVRSDVGSLPRRLARWMGGRVLPRVAYPVIKGPLRGRRFVLGSAAGDGGGASIYLGWMEEDKTSALCRVLSPDQIVFDVGANIGYYTVLAAKIVGPGGTVVSFEPFARNLSYLHRHLELNRATNVTVIPAACADRTGLSLFVPGQDCATGSLLVGEEVAASSAGHRPTVVATTTIDEVVRLTGLVPDVLKIDVEGAESRVLCGATRTLASAHPTIVLGVHSRALRHECESLLETHGYAGVPICDAAHGDVELLFTASSTVASGGAAGAR